MNEHVTEVKLFLRLSVNGPKLATSGRPGLISFNSVLDRFVMGSVNDANEELSVLVDVTCHPRVRVVYCDPFSEVRASFCNAGCSLEVDSFSSRCPKDRSADWRYF